MEMVRRKSQLKSNFLALADPRRVPGEEQARGEGEEGVRQQGVPGGQGPGRALPIHTGNSRRKGE